MTYLPASDKKSLSMVQSLFRQIYCSKEIEKCVYLQTDSLEPDVEAFYQCMDRIQRLNPSHLIFMHYGTHHSMTEYVQEHGPCRLPESVQIVSLGGYFMIHHFDWSSLPHLHTFMYQPMQPIQYIYQPMYPLRVKKLVLGPYPKTIDSLPEGVEEVYLIRNRFFRIRSTCVFPNHRVVIHAPTQSQTQHELEEVIQYKNIRRESLDMPLIELIFDLSY